MYMLITIMSFTVNYNTTKFFLKEYFFGIKIVVEFLARCIYNASSKEIMFLGEQLEMSTT